MPWVALASAATSTIGGALQANAASDAADQQYAAANSAIGEQARQYNQTRSDNAPFLATGTAANQRLRMLLGLDPASNDPASGSLVKKFGINDLNADPVYQSGLQFGADQGRDAINARATQSGMYDSGATLKALSRFGNDYGSTKANESFNRFNTANDSTYNKLAGVSGTGQVATGQVAAAGANAADNISNNITGAGNARAAGIVGGANAWGNALGGVNNAVNNYQSNQRFSALMSRYPSQPYYTGYGAGGDPQYG